MLCFNLDAKCVDTMSWLNLCEKKEKDSCINKIMSYASNRPIQGMTEFILMVHGQVYFILAHTFFDSAKGPPNWITRGYWLIYQTDHTTRIIHFLYLMV